MANVSGGRLSKQAINAVFTVNDANGDGYLDQVCQLRKFKYSKLFLGENCASPPFLSEFKIENTLFKINTAKTLKKFNFL